MSFLYIHTHGSMHTLYVKVILQEIPAPRIPKEWLVQAFDALDLADSWVCGDVFGCRKEWHQEILPFPKIPKYVFLPSGKLEDYVFWGKVRKHGVN